ncbi:MAG TPA: fused MFS/spermidine synthase [Candidatus Binatia bacterium]|nr:fused MFS/spermidine synthase [Candidatus Binatia bacterium]
MAKHSRARRREHHPAESGAVTGPDRSPAAARAGAPARPSRPQKRRGAATEDPLGWIATALGAAFVASGAAGLIHEVVWTRLLGHLFGVSSFAISTVLAAYMGGLALGSWWIGARTATLRDSRRAYAWLELAIGICALAVPSVLALVEPVYGAIWRRFHFSFAVFSALRFAIASAILIVPTALMGATLPVLSDYLARREGRHVAPQWLYTLNLAGAVAGVAAAGFVLLPKIGVWGTIVVGAGLNVAVALAVLVLPAPPPPGPEADAAPAPRDETTGGGRRRRAAARDAEMQLPAGALLVAAFVSGAVALATQVAWSRVLTLIVGSTTYAFTSVLLVYLIALGAGSALAARGVARRGSAAVALVVAYAVTALLAVVAVMIVHRMPVWYLSLYSVWGPDVANGIIARGLVSAFAVMFPPVLVAGTILPLVLVSGAPEDARETGSTVGRIYAVNTIGSIVGSVLGGFVLVPGIGSQATILGMALLCLATALALAFSIARPTWLRPALAVAAVPVLAYAIFGQRWDFARLHMGVFEAARHAGGSEYLRQRLDSASPEEFGTRLYEHEGRTASVLVTQIGPVRGMKIDARANASDDPQDMSTQTMLGLYPLALAPDAKDVFVVGWGSGVTVGATLQAPVESVTAVELEPAVVEASQYFGHVNHSPLGDPRVHLFEDDARHILLASDQTYDVIISEPPHPWVSGVANLFTRDFYELAARRLRPDGVFAQWVQSYQIDFDVYRSILASFRSVFPESAVLYVINSYDTILIGSRKPLKFDVHELDRVWSNPTFAAELERVGMERPEFLLAGIALGSEALGDLTRDVPLNTDDNMLVEFGASAGTTAGSQILWQLEQRATPVEQLVPDGQAFLADRDRLAAYIAGRRAMERDTTAYEALLGEPSAEAEE